MPVRTGAPHRHVSDLAGDAAGCGHVSHPRGRRPGQGPVLLHRRRPHLGYVCCFAPPTRCLAPRTVCLRSVPPPTHTAASGATRQPAAPRECARCPSKTMPMRAHTHRQSSRTNTLMSSGAFGWLNTSPLCACVVRTSVGDDRVPRLVTLAPARISGVWRQLYQRCGRRPHRGQADWHQVHDDQGCKRILVCPADWGAYSLPARVFALPATAADTATWQARACAPGAYARKGEGAPRAPQRAKRAAAHALLGCGRHRGG